MRGVKFPVRCRTLRPRRRMVDAWGEEVAYGFGVVVARSA